MHSNRLSGVIIPMDADHIDNEILLKQFMPNIKIVNGKIENWEEFENFCLSKEQLLDSMTKKYMCGQDDGMLFYFTDNAQALEIIKNIFIVFDLTTIHSGDFPWDYDYRRDLGE